MLPIARIPPPLNPGGDLHYHLTQHGVFSEPEVRFYGAELILGLEHLHSLNIVYRDLKVRRRQQLRKCIWAYTYVLCVDYQHMMLYVLVIPHSSVMHK